MRRTVVVAALLATCPLVLTGQDQRGVATGNVNVRSGQSMASRIPDALGTGDTVTVLSRTLRRGYHHIQEAAAPKAGSTTATSS